MQCQNCSYIRLSTDNEPTGQCPRCGLIYGKYLAQDQRVVNPPPIPLDVDYKFWWAVAITICLALIFISVKSSNEKPGAKAPIARVASPASTGGYDQDKIGQPVAAPMTDAKMLERLTTLEDLEDPGALGFQEMRKLYSMLANNNQSVAIYRQRVIELEAEIIAAEAKERAEDAAYAASEEKRKARERNIKGQFSAWDGSHNALTRIIKSQMKNPDSYQHVRTTWSPNEDYLYVETTYRGTNSFGAIVPGTSAARFTIEGVFIGAGRGVDP